MPVLTQLGEVLRPGGEVVIVPGNHDHHLLAGWRIWREGAAGSPEIGLSAEVDWIDQEPLHRLASALGAAGATVTARYPGIWLREDVYATHGHYLDPHTTVPILERISAGVNARVLRRSIAELRRTEDYEAILAPSYAWIVEIAQSRSGEDAGTGGTASSQPDASMRIWQALGSRHRGFSVKRRMLAAGVGALLLALNRAGLGPLHTDLSASELRRASLLAFGEALDSLSVRADYAIFGHSHRAGPLPGDATSEWRTLGGTTLINSGCWVHEQSFLGSDPSRSPYRAGFAVVIDGDAAPQLVNVLDPVTLV